MKRQIRLCRTTWRRSVRPICRDGTSRTRGSFAARAKFEMGRSMKELTLYMEGGPFGNVRVESVRGNSDSSARSRTWDSNYLVTMAWRLL